MSEENNSISKANEENSNKKFIRGDHGLPFTFWGGGVGATVAYLSFVGSVMDSVANETFACVAMGLFFIYSIFISIAIWRASDKYKGPAQWGVFAKIAVIFTLGAVLLIYFYLLAMLTSEYPNH